MRAAKIVQGEINLRAIDVDVRIVGEGEANAVVEGEDELAVGDMIFEAPRRGQRRRVSLAGLRAERGLEWRS